MKTPALLFLVAIAFQLHAAPPPKGAFTARPQTGAGSLSNNGFGPFAPDGRVISFAPATADSVEIVRITQQPPDASGRRRIAIQVKYTLVSFPKGMICLGFNLTSATSFRLMSDRWVEQGRGEIELAATIVPVTWPDGRPFKAFVNLSAEPHPKSWSSLAAQTKVIK